MPRQEIAPATIDGNFASQSTPEDLRKRTEIAAFENQTPEDEIAKRYGYERFDRAFIENQVWAGAECIARRQYEVGMGIALLAEVDGDSHQKVCERLQLNRAFGYQCVRFYRLVQQAPNTLTFARRNSVCAALELAVLPVDEADKIMRDTLEDSDPLDRMTVKDVRALARKQRDLLAAKDELIGTKDQKINALDRDLRTWKKSEAREKAEVILQDAYIQEVVIRSACAKLEAAARKALAEYGDSQTPLDDDTREQINELVALANAHTARLNILIQR
jgi:hypothetical protein